jgi:hypothetical protein
MIQASTLDCVAQGAFGQPDAHRSAKLGGNSVSMELGTAFQYQVTASAMGSQVLLMASKSEQRISSSGEITANLRVEVNGQINEYFCSIK